MKNEIVFYRSGELAEHIEVKLKEETVWLNRNQLATLFGRDVKTIGKHITSIFFEGELDKDSTIAKFATVQQEGERKIERLIEHYNLDVIISVGYRVKSKQGTQFRIWATNVLREYLLKGYAVNRRMDRIESQYDNLSKEVRQICFQLQRQELPNQGIFFEGQIFDAYIFAAKIIKKAKKEIILIDNYIDESTIALLSKKGTSVRVRLFTQRIGNQLQLDIKKANEQYANTFEINELKNSHDRFIIVDQKELYHLGASLKDLGKKWFAFSQMNGFVNEVINRLK